MAKWFKFEEKKPGLCCDLIIWHPRLGRYLARRAYAGIKYHPSSDPNLPKFILEEATHWQYAPKGPKEDREKS